jgi:glycine/D-amino acid oxidase-like deaminating enzyme
MSGHAEVVVIGLGALGSATAWQLARRGIRVVGLERFEFGHVRGASHGDSRIIRLSYHTPGYVRSAAEAYDDWSHLEIDSGRHLVLRCGGVDVFPRGAAIDIQEYAASMTAAHVPFETLDAGEARERWPALAFPKGSTVLHQQQAGIVPASLATAVLRQRAVAHGALLRERSPVIALREVYDGVEAVCADGAPRAGPRRRADHRRLDQPAARRARHQPAADRDQGARRPLRRRRPGGGVVRTGRVPRLDLDGRPVVLRLSQLRRDDGQGRPGLRRPPGRPGRA